MSEDPIASIRTRLHRFKGKYPEICSRYDLQYSWLSKFACGERGARPSFDLITKLEAALTDMEAANEDAAPPIPATDATPTTQPITTPAN